VTTRQFGESKAPYAYFNTADHVDDKPRQVALNRQRIEQELALLKPVQWLQQVHGTEVVDARPDGQVAVADAVYSNTAGQACAVMTADCLPVLFCNSQGTEVAAAHAGWRGLAAGVLEATAQRFSAPATELMAWFGPAIGPDQFEVGEEVLDSFLAAENAGQHEAIRSAFSRSQSQAKRYYANLYHLAELRLRAIGVTKFYGGHWCTFSEKELFYSYRRENVTGRMASIIYIKQPLQSSQ
jgi:hypothetical protein